MSRAASCGAPLCPEKMPLPAAGSLALAWHRPTSSELAHRHSGRFAKPATALKVPKGPQAGIADVPRPLRLCDEHRAERGLPPRQHHNFFIKPYCDMCKLVATPGEALFCRPPAMMFRKADSESLVRSRSLPSESPPSSRQNSTSSTVSRRPEKGSRM